MRSRPPTPRGQVPTAPPTGTSSMCCTSRCRRCRSFGNARNRSRESATPRFAARLQALRDTPLVDYRGVAEAEIGDPRALVSRFSQSASGARHRAGGGVSRASWRPAARRSSACPLRCPRRAPLRGARLCLGMALLASRIQGSAGPGGGAVRRAERLAHSTSICILQWLAHEQLAEAQALARELGMPIGLYGDYAVGTHPSGSETWVDQTGLPSGRRNRRAARSTGAQRSGLGYCRRRIRSAMEAERLQGFSRLIRNNMRYYGALRLDHVMSLFRLWWVAAGRSPTEGAYVHYPLHQLLTVLWRWKARAAPAWWWARISAWFLTKCAGPCPNSASTITRCCCSKRTDGRFRRPEEFVRRGARDGHHTRHADLAQLLGGTRHRAPATA